MTMALYSITTRPIVGIRSRHPLSPRPTDAGPLHPLADVIRYWIWRAHRSTGSRAKPSRTGAWDGAAANLRGANKRASVDGRLRCLLYPAGLCARRQTTFPMRLSARLTSNSSHRATFPPFRHRRQRPTAAPTADSKKLESRIPSLRQALSDLDPSDPRS